MDQASLEMDELRARVAQLENTGRALLDTLWIAAALSDVQRAAAEFKAVLEGDSAPV